MSSTGEDDKIDQSVSEEENNQETQAHDSEDDEIDPFADDDDEDENIHTGDNVMHDPIENDEDHNDQIDNLFDNSADENSEEEEETGETDGQTNTNEQKRKKGKSSERKLTKDEKMERALSEQATSFMAKLMDAGDADKLSIENNQPPLRRIALLAELETTLVNKAFVTECYKQGFLREMDRWLTLDKGLPPFSVRETIYKLLAKQTYISKETMKETTLGKTLLKLSKNSQETPENQKLIINVIKLWLSNIQKETVDRDITSQQIDRVKDRKKDALLYAPVHRYEEKETGYSRLMKRLQKAKKTTTSRR
ncbi:hypothetical protein WA158_008222 [Blastocystis sp. Blastoise]